MYTMNWNSPLCRKLYQKTKNKCAFLYKEIGKADTPGGYIDDKFIVMDPSNPQDIETWREIVNSAYSDASYTLDEAYALLTNHPAVYPSETAFYLLDGKKAATISYGPIRSAGDTGGFFRIAVLPEHQKKGIGTELLRYAEAQLLSKDISRVEETIKLKRIGSLIMHFKAGYQPETSYAVRANKPKSFGKKAAAMVGYELLIKPITMSIYREFYLNKRT